ncbi:cytochrome c oxidase subunit 3 family protein [Thauera sp.]
MTLAVPLSPTVPAPDPAPAPLPAQASAGRIPGSKAMWVGIFCEITEFALLFAVFFIARAHHPEAFQAGPERLSLLAGTGYTLMLLTSGWCVARALHAMRRGDKRATVRWMLAGFVFGLGYPAIKIFELQRNFALGLDGSAGVFIVSYYYLTFTHLVHVFWGLLGMMWVIVRTGFGAYTAEEHSGLEAFACYWHVTDMIWLMIFPLFYLLG